MESVPLAKEEKEEEGEWKWVREEVKNERFFSPSFRLRTVGNSTSLMKQ